MKIKSQTERVELYDIEKEIADLPADAQEEFLSAFGNYKMYIPEFEEPVNVLDGKEYKYGRTRRADLELKAVTRDLNGKRLSEKKILQNIFAITMRMRAKVEQLRNNKTFLEKLEVHEIHEDARLFREKEMAAKGGKPGDLRRMMRQRFVASTPEIFEAAPRTKLKMAEEMVVSPTERLEYKVESREVKQDDLSSLIVDPAMLNDTLLRNLGLGEFVLPKKSPMEEKLNSKVKAIEPAREALQSLYPLGVNRGPILDRYMRSFASDEGYVVGTTYTTKGKQLFRADLVDAKNRITHIREGYESEIPRLTKIRQVVKGVDKRVDEEWAKVKDAGELEKIKAEFSELVDDLWLVNNKFKVEVRDLLMDCLTLESTFKRKVKGADGKVKEEVVTRANPGAKRAKWNLVPGKIDQRIKEISNIAQHLGGDEMRIIDYKSQHDRIPFGALQTHIEDRALANRKNTKAKAAVLDENERESLQGSLGYWKMKFMAAEGKAFLQPYRAFADRVVEAIEKAEAALNSTDKEVSRKEVADAVLKVFLVVKLQTFWTQIQSIYERHLSSRDLPYFVELRNGLTKLFASLRDKKIAATVKTPEFDDVYHALYNLLEKLIKMSEEGKDLAKAKDEKAAWKVKGKMHKLVADTDIVELLKRIKI